MEISNELRKLVDPNNECCCANCLSNNCKEWASAKGYIIAQDNKGFTMVKSLSDGEKKIWEDDDISYSIERIFQSCEWILQQKRLND